MSVVIPTYNAAALLRQAVNSVLRQTLPAGEIVIVDDGSTDATREMVGQFGSSITYRYQPNRGVASARNAGIQLARYPWIAFLDADDEWMPHKLQAQLALLERHPQIRWCASARTLLHHHGRGELTPLVPVASPPHEDDNEGEVLDYFQSQRERSEVESFQTSGFVLHRSVFAEVGHFDPSLKVSEDRDMWWRVAMRFPFLCHCSRVCYYYRAGRDGSLTNQDRCRSQSLQTVCRTMRTARSRGSAAVDAFTPYGRALAVNYLRRWAAREIALAPEVVAEAHAVFPLHWTGRLWLQTLRSLPGPAARLLARWPPGRRQTPCPSLDHSSARGDHDDR